MQRRHERKKEKRKKSARLQLHVQEQSLNQSQIQAGTLAPTGDPHMHPQLVETPQTEKPQKTTVKTVPKTPKARPAWPICTCNSLNFQANTLLMFVSRFQRFIINP